MKWFSTHVTSKSLKSWEPYQDQAGTRARCQSPPLCYVWPTSPKLETKIFRNINSAFVPLSALSHVHILDFHHKSEMSDNAIKINLDLYAHIIVITNLIYDLKIFILRMYFHLNKIF